MTAQAAAARRGAAAEVLGAFLRLGLTSFGGPIAHLGYFRAEFVIRRGWLAEAEFADLVALCQFLPGPASSQLGMAIGLRRAGPAGMLAAWLGFTLPSAAALVLFAYGVAALGDVGDAAWLKGLRLVAVAVVAQAVWGMARTLCPDRMRASVAVLAALLALAVPSSLGQVGAIMLGAVAGLAVLPRAAMPSGEASFAEPSLSRRVAVCALVLFLALLMLLPALAAATGGHAAAMAAAFYRAGALVFGGGHVVLPLLQDATVTQGWIGAPGFLAGYGAAQAVPGPLFTFAAYLGAAMRPAPNGWAGALICLAAIFLPSFLLVAGALPFWDRLRGLTAVRSALAGVNAAVVGILLAALFTPIWTGAVATRADFALVLTAFLALAGWRAAPWSVVLAGAVGTAGLAAAGVAV